MLLFSIFCTLFFHPVKGRVGCIEGYHNLVKFDVHSYYGASRGERIRGYYGRIYGEQRFKSKVSFFGWMAVGGILTVDDLWWICIICIRRVEKQYVTFYFFVRWKESFVTCVFFFFFRLLEFDG